MFFCALHALASVLLIVSSSDVDRSLGNAPAFANDQINTVIGNESFRARFGREPNQDDDEDLRIGTHLRYVEEQLRDRPIDHLSPELRAERLRNLDRLRAYHLRAAFPRNYDMTERRPCFIDRDGTICAVGYLVEQSAGREVAEEINREYKYARIREMETQVLTNWIAGSGLIPEEVAMIQPEYTTHLNPADYGISVGAGVVAQNDYIPSSREGRAIASSQSGIGGSLSGGLYLDIPIGPTVIHTSGVIIFDSSDNVVPVKPRAYPLKNFYLHVRPNVDYRWGGFEGAGTPMVGTDGVDTLFNLPTHYSATYQYASLNTDLLLGYYVGRDPYRSWLQVLAGTTIGVGGLFGVEREEHLTPADSNPDTRLLKLRTSENAGGERGLTMHEGSLGDVPGLRVGLKGGVRWKDALSILRHIPDLHPDIYAACSLWYTYDLTPLVSGSDWRSHSLHLSLDISLAGRPEPW